jgi:arylsulfatase A-like enzyme
LIHRVCWFAACLVAFAGLVAGCRCQGAGPGEPVPPNVLLVTIDTLRPDHLGCYGYGRPTSPTIDRLAAEGVLFENAIADASWTVPSIAAILTGRHAPGLGVLHVDSVLSPEATTAARLFGKAGYDTAAFTSGAYFGERHGWGNGFGTYREIPAGDRAAAVNGAAIPWLEKKRERPFFLWVHLFDPHSPYDPPAEFGGRFTAEKIDHRLGEHMFLARVCNGNETLAPGQLEQIQTLYDQEIAYADDQLGRLVAAARAAGGDRRTVIAVGSDHGEAFMEHGLLLHLITLYDEMIRVPLILHDPERLPRGARIASQVRNVDIAPTLLELAGLSAPTGIDGRSLLPLVRGEERGDRVAYVHTDALSHLEFYEKHLPNAQVKRFEVLAARRTRREKVIFSLIPGRRESYDLAADQGEQRDLQASDAGRFEAGHADLQRWLAESRASAPAGKRVSLTPDDLARLRELGYLR